MQLHLQIPRVQERPGKQAEAVGVRLHDSHPAYFSFSALLASDPTLNNL